jgi:NAD(P)H-nitrite reductase large subunit
LSKALIPDVDKILIRSKEWYSKASVEIMSDTVTSVDFSKKSVSTKSGSQVPYTKLILATGGTPRRLPLPGFKDLNNIFTLRNITDVQSILAAIGEKKGKNIVVVGSSFIGMEVGNCLSKDNTVTIIGMETAPLERVMGEQVGKIFQTQLEKNGVKFYMGASVDSATPADHDSAAVGAVKLKDGTNIPTDLVVLGIGVAPATEYLRDNEHVKLEKDGSLRVDENFQLLGQDDVFAIGDIATYPYHGPGGNGTPTRIEHWS